jgi:hypothetical protein
LRKRFYEHKQDYKRWVNGKYHYVSSFEVLKDGMCYIELLEKYPCNDKNELKRREGEVMRSMECVNKQIAGRSIEEYRKDNNIEIKKKHKEHRVKYKEEYYKRFNCDCGGVYTKINKWHHMQTKKHKSWEEMQHDS